jgi:hypothetical protein
VEEAVGVGLFGGEAGDEVAAGLEGGVEGEGWVGVAGFRRRAVRRLQAEEFSDLLPRALASARWLRFEAAVGVALFEGGKAQAAFFEDHRDALGEFGAGAQDVFEAGLVEAVGFDVGDRDDGGAARGAGHQAEFAEHVAGAAGVDEALGAAVGGVHQASASPLAMM